MESSLTEFFNKFQIAIAHKNGKVEFPRLKILITFHLLLITSCNTISELGTRYFKSNDDIGTDTLLKKYRRYR